MKVIALNYNINYYLDKWVHWESGERKTSDWCDESYYFFYNILVFVCLFPNLETAPNILKILYDKLKDMKMKISIWFQVGLLILSSGLDMADASLPNKDETPESQREEEPLTRDIWHLILSPTPFFKHLGKCGTKLNITINHSASNSSEWINVAQVM